MNPCEVYSANTSSKLCEFNFQLNFRSILKREQKTRLAFWPYENMHALLMVRPCVLINIIKCLKGLWGDLVGSLSSVVKALIVIVPIKERTDKVTY